MKTPNLSWLYEVEYYQEIRWDRLAAGNPTEVDIDKIRRRNQALFSTSKRLDEAPAEPPTQTQSFTLRTTYPGLISGSGYPHEMGLEGELKLGFSFDYTTGRPYIPGSSVKGLLRSIFENELAIPYLTDVLKRLGVKPSQAELPVELWIEQLVRETFAGEVTQATTNEAGRWKLKDKKVIGPGRRDIWYDAFAVASHHQGSENELAGALVGPDFITPHLNRDKPHLSPFTDPVPIQFLKVLPEVDFRFDFRLVNSSVAETLTADKKAQLFKTFLLDFGIGAKTNVGYGQLRDPKAKKEATQHPGPTQATRSDAGVGREQQPVSPQKPDWSQVRVGTEISGKVEKGVGRKLFVRLNVTGYDRLAEIPYSNAAKYVGRNVLVKVAAKKGDRRAREDRFTLRKML